MEVDHYLRALIVKVDIVWIQKKKKILNLTKEGMLDLTVIKNIFGSRTPKDVVAKTILGGRILKLTLL